MAHVKTALSLEEPLLNQVDALAREMKISRSRLFVIAVEQFIQQQQNQALLDALNTAYEDSPDLEERQQQQRRRRHHFQLVKEEW
jgi:metal-responsive CopG/Arc/MetJ family transcriptional regulator